MEGLNRTDPRYPNPAAEPDDEWDDDSVFPEEALNSLKREAAVGCFLCGLDSLDDE